MNPRDDLEIERMLEALTPAPAPPGLRGRVLGGLATSGRRTAGSARPLRAWSIACSALLAAVLLVDARIERSWTARLRALAGYPQGPAAKSAPSPVVKGLIDPLSERIWNERISLLADARASERSIALDAVLRLLKEERYGY